MCRTLLKLSALVIAVQVVCACVEQSPDKYASPEFGNMELDIDGTRVTVQCGIRKADERFTYGFILKNGNDGPDVKEINICQYQGETIDLSASPYITLLHLYHCTSLKTLYLNKAVDINAVELLTEGCTFQIEYK